MRTLKLYATLFVVAATGCSCTTAPATTNGLFVGYADNGLCLGLQLAEDRLTAGFLAGHPSGVWPLQNVEHVGAGRYVVESGWGVWGKSLVETWDLTIDRGRVDETIEVTLAGRRGDHRYSWVAFRIEGDSGQEVDPR